jgi:hypothetical protein
VEATCSSSASGMIKRKMRRSMGGIKSNAKVEKSTADEFYSSMT